MITVKRWCLDCEKEELVVLVSPLAKDSDLLDDFPIILEGA